MDHKPVPMIGVLISGRGSNLRALVDAKLPAGIGVVISNRADAPGLDIARVAGIEALVMPHTNYGSRDEYDQALVKALRDRRVTLVCLAGFMRRLGAGFCEAFPNAILNVHPSLLPAFPGTEAQRQALEHGVRVAGATVHLVTPELDAGPIVMQAVVPVGNDDTVDALSARILVQEHRLYPEAVRLILAGGWRVEGRRLMWRHQSQGATR